MSLADTLTEDGIARADAGADSAWKERALLAVELCASEYDTFTADEVWLAGLDKPREGRALGAIMRRAVKEGWIEKTDRVRPSIIPENHKKPQHIWASKIRKEVAA